MPRKLRLEFAGACYHVINRGNYRADIFKTEGARSAFEACLLEASAKSNWVLHAFVVMTNHYHLAVETPDGNLGAGMQWLQATFANRFNRLRGERGHLFQGRYKALLVEEGGPLGQVCHYLHLNPVRAGIVPTEKLGEYRYSSYWYLGQPKGRPKCLDLQTALVEAGALADTPAGRKQYGDYLAWHAAEGPAGRNAAYVSLSKGWALGTKEFRAALVKAHALAADARAWETPGAKEIREQVWEEKLQQALVALGREESELTVGVKSARWKVALATFLKERTQASNPWLAVRLGMNRPVYVSRLVSEARRTEQPMPELERLRAKCKA